MASLYGEIAWENDQIMHQDITVVLGMHRSGTSCLTGQLQQAGLALGEVIEQAPFNQKGNRESPHILSLNNALMSYNGGSWDDPTDELTWLESHEEQRDRVLSRYADIARWGFKDPRSLFTLPFWLEGLPGAKVRYIGCIRHPLSVARSLHSRNAAFSVARGIELWRRYNENLIGYQTRYGFPLVDFDLELRPYVASIERALKYLELGPGVSASKLDFFDDELRHQHPPIHTDEPGLAEVLESALPLYAQLKAQVI